MIQPRIFGLRNNDDYSAKAFLKANKRCWSLNPLFFINDEIKIAFLSTRLAGTAEIWFSSLEDRNDPCLEYLNTFCDKFLLEFATTRTEWQIRVDLHTHRQGKRTISEFTSSFRALASQCNYSDEALLTGYFLGLNANVQIYLESLQTMPVTFNDIVATCLDYGSRKTIISRSQSQTAHSSTRSFVPPPPPGVPSQPMEVDVISSRPTTSIASTSQPRPSLTQEEKEHRLRNNLCLYCGSSQHLVGQCTVKPKNYWVLCTNGRMLWTNLIPTKLKKHKKIQKITKIKKIMTHHRDSPEVYWK